MANTRRPATQDHLKPQSETSTEAFTFTGVDGEEYQLPPSEALTGGMIRRNRHLSEVDMAFTILEELVDEDTMAALDKLPIKKYNETLQAWQKHIGMSPGK